VPSADKRQRKKENARQAREAREAQLKKQKRNRTIRNAVIAVVVFAVAFGILTLVTRKDKKKVVASPTTTTVPPKNTTTVASTVATPGATVPAAELAAVKCNTTKPPTTAAKNQKQSAPPQTIDPAKTYTALISTSCGDITVALDAKNAPKGVNNFVFLARQGFYDGLTWHRVVKDFVIQGGDPLGTGGGSPGYSTPTEMPLDGYPLGTLAYAKTSDAAAGDAGSQFFVVTSDHPGSLEQKANGSYQYGVFGHVTAGIAVAKKMEGFAPATGDGPPIRPLYIFKVTITEK
jgi:cyclophilin family peptidyl-prolyl cis-trans isomerase